MATWFLAASPIRRSVSVKATNEGVVRLPWSLAMISHRSSRKIPTQEYVVPRSIPTAGPIDIVNDSVVCSRKKGV
ncbi:hypothetical protein GGI35DRAFT_456703 [Trichoderma velutinum]